MMLRKTTAIAAFTVWCAGCGTVEVHLTAKNPESFPQKVHIDVLTPKGETEKQISAGVVAANSAKVVEHFAVKKGGAFRVWSALPGSATLHSETREVSPRGGAVRETVELRHGAGVFLDDPRAIYAATVAFKKICPDAGTYPMELESALQTKLRGLVLFDDAQREVMSLSAGQVGVGEVTPKSIVYPSAMFEGEVVISGRALAEVAQNVPLYRSFRFATDDRALYRLQWFFEGVGPTALPSTGEDAPAAFDALSDTVKGQLSDAAALTRSGAVYYLDNAYLAKFVRVSLNRGRVLGEGEEVAPGDVITSQGVYRFEPGAKVVKEYHGVVLNFYGEEMAIQRVPKGTLSHGVTGSGRQQDAVFEVTAVPTGKRRAIPPESLRIVPAQVRTYVE